MDTKNKFVEKYIEQAVGQLKLKFPNKTDKQLRSYVIKRIEETEIKSNYNVVTRDPNNIDTKTTMLDVLVYLEEEKPIISGVGALYQQHKSGVNNILLEMVQMLLNIRKVYKKKKLQALDAGDKALVSLFDKYQLTYKLLANSFFGAAGQPQSIFFDPHFPSAIMYTGQIIIMTAITLFEKISGNYRLDRIGDAFLYIDRIINKEYKTDVISKLNIIPTKEQVYELIKEHYEGANINYSNLKDVIYKLSQENLTKIYYTNNLLKFIENDVIKETLHSLIGHEFLDPNCPSDEIKSNIYKLWDYVRDCCMYEYIPLNRTDFCHHHIRKTVLTVDTDSNFLYNRPFTNKLREFFPEELKDYEQNKSIKLSCISISMFIFIRLIAEGYDHMGKQLNIDDEHRPIINMKNEFTYSRLMTTPQKKHYAGMLMAQEGVILTGPPDDRRDMKGLQLRKSSLNSNIRTFFTKTLTEKILLPEKIDLSEIYKDFQYMENEITKSLKEGSLQYCLLGKVNNIENYAAPMQQQTVRGTLLWNALFPENPIQPPNKLNYVKLKEIPYNEFIARVPEEYRDRLVELYSRKSAAQGQKSLSDYEVSIICLPKNIKEMPKFLIQFIDIESMVHDQIKAAMEILTPLDFKSLDILDKSFSTNIISI